MTSSGIIDKSMKRYILETKQVIHPFELPASKLPVLNKPIFEHQKDIFRQLKIKDEEDPVFISSLKEINPSTSQTLVYRDDIYFNEELLLEFLRKALAIGKPARLAFLDTDPCFSVYASYPQHNNMEHVGNLYLGDFFFIPAGAEKKYLEKGFTPVILDTESIPLSYFSLPSAEFDSGLNSGKSSSSKPSTSLVPIPPLQLQVPRLSYIAIKHWVQLLFANFTWGIHRQIRQLNSEINNKIENKNLSLGKEQSPLSKRRGSIQIGKNCQIDPTATIIGPTNIGNEVFIGPNVTIEAAHIGDNAVLEPGCTVWFGVLGARSSLLANRNMVMSCVMSDSIVNTDLRFSIVGSNSFLGAGSHITDCILRNANEDELKMNDPKIDSPMVKVLAGEEIIDSGYYVLGPAIGNRVKIGSGMIIYPGRMIKSDSLILPKEGYYVIDK
jgi:carbonic anhydrase/acetyltransferase-like protein (isoleucine patch superfamily)